SEFLFFFALFAALRETLLIMVSGSSPSTGVPAFLCVPAPLREMLVLSDLAVFLCEKSAPSF
ncbi:MAG: hypothetical protein KAQ74_06990, partial [Dehalococcoidia bacterium]|nr:hypothetical protein [Dehalococcoidia bacterium]